MYFPKEFKFYKVLMNQGRSVVLSFYLIFQSNEFRIAGQSAAEKQGPANSSTIFFDKNF